jgi:hypothetical protein
MKNLNKNPFKSLLLRVILKPVFHYFNVIKILHLKYFHARKISHIAGILPQCAKVDWHFAILSGMKLPVLFDRCKATAKSAIIVSSVSPERCDITDVTALCAIFTAAIVFS